MTKRELKKVYFGYGRVFAHSLTDNPNYPQRYALALERVMRFLTTLTDPVDVTFREQLIDAFMLGASKHFAEEV